MNLTGAQIVVECLKEQGVDTVFGYPGGTILNVYDALYQHSEEITHILTSHEQGAAHAADGYARATGKVGVCLATSGPGATNLVTGIATAYMDSVPMVAITCNVNLPLLGKDSFQEVDIAGITMPITKHNYIVKDVNILADTLRKAFAIAGSGRPGPVLVDITKDVTANTCEYEKMTPEKAHTQGSYTEEELAEAVCLLENAKKPFIYIGPPPASKSRTITAVEYDTGKEVSEFSRFSAVAGGGAMSSDFGGDVVTSFDYAYIGDSISLNGSTLYVRGVQDYLQDGTLVCKYTIGRKSSFAAAPIANTQAAGKIMTGIVQNVEMDKVQVFFNSIDSSYDGSGDWWFPYSTSYSSQDGSGWYSMPAAGDEVRVFFPSGNEGEAFAACSIQINPGERVTDKIWSGPNGKKILLTEDGLMIIGKEAKLFINLMDLTGIEIISDKNITITSACNVNIQAGDTVNVLAENHILLGTQASYVDIRNEGITMSSENIILT